MFCLFAIENLNIENLYIRTLVSETKANKEEGFSSLLKE